MKLTNANDSDFLMITNFTDFSFYELIFDNNSVNNSEHSFIDDNGGDSIKLNTSFSVVIGGEHSTAANNNFVEFRDQSRFWIQRVLVPIITMVGVLGNSMTIVIMTRKRMRSSTNLYLAALAIFDMLYLIFTFVLSLSHYPNSRHSKFYFYWIFFPLSLLICDASSNISVWLTVTFTIERYIVVWHPIKGKIWCTYSRARNLIVLISLIILLITLPTTFEWKITTRVTSANETVVQLMQSELGLNTVYKKFYYWLTVIIFVFIPLILLAVFNTFLIRSVRVSNVRRRTLTKTPSKCDNHISGTMGQKRPKNDSLRQETRITIMLIAVVILFLICQLPSACILIYTAFEDENEEQTNTKALIRGLGNIFNFLVAINCAGNFVLYSLLSHKYRRTFRKTFCECFADQKESNLRRTVVHNSVQTNSVTNC